MSNDSNKFQVSNIMAACILGASLIGAAQIVARKPAPPIANPSINSVVESAPNAASSAKALAAPPLAQESVQKQFREQVLAAPRLHVYRKNGKNYNLADIKVTQVIYTAKEDTFLVRFEWVWKEGMPLGQSWGNSASLFNDGYGHYYGTVVLSPIVGGSGQNADVTIK